jgi:hypothetical protein
LRWVVVSFVQLSIWSTLLFVYSGWICHNSLQDEKNCTELKLCYHHWRPPSCQWLKISTKGDNSKK